MSVDINIRAKKEVEVYDATITYNLTDMYYRAIDREQGLRKLDGMTCKDALPIINNAITDMIENKDEYEQMNPPNGWGMYDGLLKEFREMRNACEENPDGIFYTD